MTVWHVYDACPKLCTYWVGSVYITLWRRGHLKYRVIGGFDWQKIPDVHSYDSKSFEIKTSAVYAWVHVIDMSFKIKTSALVLYISTRYRYALYRSQVLADSTQATIDLALYLIDTTRRHCNHQFTHSGDIWRYLPVSPQRDLRATPVSQQHSHRQRQFAGDKIDRLC